MARFRHLLSGCALVACGAPTFAQSPYGQPVAQPGYVNPFAPMSDADQLAQQLKLVAANPTDLYALLSAAALSLKVGDTDAAAALYTRAERVNPQHPRVKAGMARLLVQSGRPGAALRKFQEAERLGATLADFGADRALAYDLVGEQPRAQREYRALLRGTTDDETTRRYALSLGISGLKEPALALLEPLNRRSDRGAWRARAFVLAMTGDRAGADRIATTMMPPGMAQGLAPFFDRLPRLSATERAFAVNFGETRASPTRLADARLLPSLPALSPEPDPFPQARASTQLAAREDIDDGKRKKKRNSKKDKPEPVRVARQPYIAPLPPPPAPTATQLAALSASRPSAGAFMPARSGGQVTVLPPPADAYRGPTTAVAAAPASAADSDEPDFAVAAVSALAGNRQPAARPPAKTPAATLAGRPAIIPGATPGGAGSTTLAATVPPPVTGAARASLPSRDASSGLSNFTLAGAAPVVPPATIAQPDASTILPAPVVSGTTNATPGFSQSMPGTVATTTATAPATTDVAPSAAMAAVTPGAPSSALTTAAITSATGAPPLPQGARGDDVLAAILAGIKVPEAELAGPIAVPPSAVSPPATGTRLLANIDKQAAVAKPAVKSDAAKPEATLPKKDARGRFVDARGRPLLDARGRAMDAKGAAAWLAAQDDKPGSPATKDNAEPSLPKKNAQGRFVDAKGKPLLDERGRPMGPKGAAAWQAAQNENADAPPADKARADPSLPKKDARGRFVDAAGKPLLDPRGRPMDAKAAAAWKLAEAKKPTDAKAKPDPAKGEPQRFWVQVAGGANQATLAREWTRVSAATPSLKGKQGWTTPLRATNRILTGPFKTGAEAMAMVNQLKKEGLAAFMFTSDAGQKVERLDKK